MPHAIARHAIVAGALFAFAPLIFAADISTTDVPALRAEPLPVTVSSIQTQRVVWHGRNANGPAATTVRDGPQLVCNPLTASVADGFNAIGPGSSMILQLGTVQGEGFASSYTFPAAAFPIEITLFECYFASVAPVTTVTGWQLDVFDGPPDTGTNVFSVISDPDPSTSGLPGDVIINPASASCETQAAAIKLQFSVDQTAAPADKMVVNNTSGTGTITVVIRIIRANNPGGTCQTLDECSNAFLGSEGQGHTLNFPNDNWLHAISCPGGAPTGYTRFANLSPLYRPTTDVLHQITFVPTNCTAIPNGACCLNSGQCVVVTPQSCTGQSGTYRGDNVTCAAANCPQPQGACCLPFGGCDQRTQFSCQNVSGIYQGPSSVCAQVQCPEPIGACCIDSFCADELTQSFCVSSNANFQGNGTTCTANDTCPLGACCLPDGSCVPNESGPQCAMQNGLFRGVGSVCASANCPQPLGACCTSGGGCFEVTQAQCIGFPGNVWKGAFSNCTPSPCAPTGVCCRGVTCSTSIAQAQCTGANTLWVSVTPAACNVSGNVDVPCCRADFNKLAGVSPQDLFSFLSAWFAGNPLADFTGNGAGTPTVQSLFDFLKAWFMGQCT